MRRRTKTQARAPLGASALLVAGLACGDRGSPPASASPSPTAPDEASVDASVSADPSLEPRRVRIGPLVDHHRRQRGEAPPPIEADEVEGGWIYFVAEGEGKPAIHRIRSSGGEREVLSEGEDAEYPALLLSSGHLVAVRVREPAPDVHRESVILLDTLKQRRTRTLGSETPRARNPSAAPDSSWLVFEYGGASFSDLFRVDLRDGVLDRLTDDEEGNFEPAVSPDGQRIAFVSSRDGNAELYVMAADGKEPRRLSDDPANESAPRWSPDGRHLAFLSDRGGSDRIYVVDPAGESPTPRRLTLDRDLVGEGRARLVPGRPADRLRRRRRSDHQPLARRRRGRRYPAPQRRRRRRSGPLLVPERRPRRLRQRSPRRRRSLPARRRSDGRSRGRAGPPDQFARCRLAPALVPGDGEDADPVAPGDGLSG
ncbi:MAG: PD40 domain-containing protein [Myxococcales bacterium]|nr:PD40 domain-containing protein [Myxococcales bacterium]